MKSWAKGTRRAWMRSCNAVISPGAIWPGVRSETDPRHRAHRGDGVPRLRDGMTRTPLIGDPFRLDGFGYALTRTVRRWHEDGTLRGTRQYFTRLLGMDSHDADERLNLNYKRDGYCTQTDLVWLTPDEWHAAVEAQAAGLRFGWSPHLRVWSEGASQACREHYRHAGGCWTLPGRHLVKPPLYDATGRGDWRVVSCANTQEAYRVARAVLTNRFHRATLTASGTTA